MTWIGEMPDMSMQDPVFSPLLLLPRVPRDRLAVDSLNGFTADEIMVTSLFMSKPVLATVPGLLP